MGTHAMIGVKVENGVKAINVNFDGGVNHTGLILGGWYNTQELALALLELGDLSQLNERIAPAPNEPHSWAEPARGVTIAYHRDRGERLHPAQLFKNKDELKQLAQYAYYFDGEQWLVHGLRYGSGEHLGWIALDVTKHEEVK